MSKSENCLKCSNGKYTHGSAIYDYYSCGHAFQKPLSLEEVGGYIEYKSPYEPYKSNYDKNTLKESK